MNNEFIFESIRNTDTNIKLCKLYFDWSYGNMGRWLVTCRNYIIAHQKFNWSLKWVFFGSFSINVSSVYIENALWLI